MNFDYSPTVQELRERVSAFMREHIYANERKWHEHTRSAKRWEVVPIIEELKPKARAAGLWNLWRPKSHGGTFTNLAGIVLSRQGMESARSVRKTPSPTAKMPRP